MKATGVVRKLDDLGRIVIPMEIRRTLGITEKEPLEIYVDEDKIVLKKYIPDTERNSVKEGLENFEKLSKKDRKELMQRAIRLIG